MAPHASKTTYALDVATARSLQELAQRWNVSNSEALRRAIRTAAAVPGAQALSAEQALDRLQAALKLSATDVERWSHTARAERKAASRRREAPAR